MIPSWIVNKATRTFAPRLLENLCRVGPKYNEWKAVNNPDQKPWLAIGNSYWWETTEDTRKSGAETDEETSTPRTGRHKKKSSKRTAALSPRNVTKKRGNSEDRSNERSRSREDEK